MRLLLLASLLLTIFTFALLADTGDASGLSYLRSLATGYDHLQKLKKAVKEKIHQCGHDPNSTILSSFPPEVAQLLSKKARHMEECYHSNVKGTTMSIFDKPLYVVVFHYLKSYKHTQHDGVESKKTWMNAILERVGNLVKTVHAIAGHIIKCIHSSVSDPNYLPTKVALNRFSALSADEFATRHANPLPKLEGPMGGGYKVGVNNGQRQSRPNHNYNTNHNQHPQHRPGYNPNSQYKPNHNPNKQYKPSHNQYRPPNKPSYKPPNKPAPRPPLHNTNRRMGTSDFSEDYSSFNVDDVKDSDLPASLDYRSQNVVSHVKDQGSSQTCYIFAAVDAIESSFMLAKKKRGIRFNIKDLYNCLPRATPPIEHPEKGGNVEHVILLAKKRGVLDERIGDKYNVVDSRSVVLADPAKCKSLSQSSVVTRVKGFAKAEEIADEKFLKKILYKYGPVATVFRSPSKSEEEKHKIWSGLAGPWTLPCASGSGALAGPDHAMLLVGWNANYWILKNSYGDYGNDDRWGVRGYLLLDKRNAVNCALMGPGSQIIFPSVE